MKTVNGIEEVIDLYDYILLDAYGVILNESGLIDGFKEVYDLMFAKKKPFYIVSNGSSKPIPSMIEFYRRLGIELKPSQVITSGSLLVNLFEEQDLKDHPTVVLGPEGAFDYARKAGASTLSWDTTQDFRTLVVGNQTGFPFLEALNKILSDLIRQADQGKALDVVVPNPDAFYPVSAHQVGFTSGSIGLMLENALQLRYGGHNPVRFHWLGKPHAPIFDEAKARCGEGRFLMVGDQLYTDILGANRAKIDSLLVFSGLTPPSVLGQIPTEIKPTYVSQRLGKEA